MYFFVTSSVLQSLFKTARQQYQKLFLAVYHSVTYKVIKITLIKIDPRDYLMGKIFKFPQNGQNRHIFIKGP